MFLGKDATGGLVYEIGGRRFVVPAGVLAPSPPVPGAATSARGAGATPRAAAQTSTWAPPGWSREDYEAALRNRVAVSSPGDPWKGWR